MGTYHDPDDVLSVLGFRSPAWFADAGCAGLPEPLDFIAADTHTALKAKALQVCGRCLVMAECRAYALDDVSLVGIWGGTDTAARRAMRRTRATGDPT